MKTGKPKLPVPGAGSREVNDSWADDDLQESNFEIPGYTPGPIAAAHANWAGLKDKTNAVKYKLTLPTNQADNFPQTVNL